MTPRQADQAQVERLRAENLRRADAHECRITVTVVTGTLLQPRWWATQPIAPWVDYGG